MYTVYSICKLNLIKYFMQWWACMFVCAHEIRLPSGIWIHMIEECSRVDDPRNLDVVLMDRNPKQPPGIFQTL